MPDINKMIRDQAAHDPEVMDHLRDIDSWTRNQAVETAAAQGIAMTDEHWEVVDFLRHHYARNGRAPSGRELSDALAEHFAERGGRKYLYRLFPEGPVSQGSRVAGVPLPRYAEDASFGYSQ